jgi:hypothetical protein
MDPSHGKITQPVVFSSDKVTGMLRKIVILSLHGYLSAAGLPEQ